MTHIGICKNCGKETHYRYKSIVKQFCSHECANQYNHKQSDYWKNRRVLVKCLNCGKEFNMLKGDSRLKTERNHFCCRKCWGEYTRKQHNRVCPICGNVFHKPKNQTCSKDCGLELIKVRRAEKLLGKKYPTYQDYLGDIERISKAEKERRAAKIKTRKRKIWTKEEKRQWYAKRRADPYYREYMKKYLKEYFSKHKKERNRDNLIKCQTDPVFKMKTFVRKKISCAVKRNGKYKCKSFEELVGCSYAHFAEYLKSKFKEGMSFENYGEWQIDHIIPLVTANTVEDVIRLCHYTNLQPLWASENMEKGSKIPTQASI